MPTREHTARVPLHLTLVRRSSSMFSIEYIWSAFAITQALIVTLQVGSKLLLPPPPSITTTDVSSQPPPPIVVINSTNISREIIQRNNTISVTPLQKQNDDDPIDHIKIIESNENDLLLSAFRLAVRIGSLSCHHHHQRINDSHTLELELIDNDVDCNIWSHTSRSSTGSTIHVRRCYREKSSPSNIEPYRMSMVPAFRLYQYPTNRTSNTSNINEHIATTDETEVIQTTTTPLPSAITNLPNDTHSKLFQEYYETQCTLVQDNYVTKRHLNSSNPISKSPMVTTCYRIRAYAPQIFQQLRSYYDNHTTTTTTTDGRHCNRNKKLLESLSFESSILHRSFTFLKTNSKGSQRSKNVFFYTNGATFRRTMQVGRTNIDPSSAQMPNYLIKSIKNDEFDTLMNTILPKYVSYMKQYGTISLLNRIYGIYEITIQDDDDDDDDDNTDPNNGQRSSLDTDGDDDTITTTTQNKRQQRYYLVVFNAVFDPSLLTNTTTTTAATNKPHASRFRVYDVKGSTVGRQTKVSTDLTNDSPTPHQSSSSVTYKDVDLIQDIHQNDHTSHNNTDEHHETTHRTAANSVLRLLQLNPATKDQILKQLRNDVNFLTSCSVMDYSLLIGMEQLRTNVVDDERHRTTPIRNVFWWKRSHRNSDWREWNPWSVHYGTRKNPFQEKYYLGVIDFLQPYNYKKEIEYRWKSLIHKKNAYSCVPPDLYAQRFLDFIDEYVM